MHACAINALLSSRALQTEKGVATLRPASRLAFILGEDSPFAEIGDEVERYPKGDDVLEKKQARETHIP